MIEITIEKRVPLPAVRRVYAYPYENMEVGDSFTVPKVDRAKVLNANYRAWLKSGCRFAAKTQGEVVRVWRVE